MFRELLKEKQEEITRLTKENSELRNVIAFSQEKFESFDDRDKAVLNCIKDNPGIIRIALLKKLANEYAQNSDKSYGTSVTLNRRIDWLRDEKIIRVHEVHKQKHKLYLNDKNILLEIRMDLMRFKDEFYNLMNLIVETKNESVDFKDYALSHIMIDIYHQIINSYIIQILLKWPYEFRNDPTIINQINFIVFFTLSEINSAFYRKFNFKNMLTNRAYSLAQVSSPLLREIIHNSFILNPNFLIQSLKHYKRSIYIRNFFP